MSDMDAEARAMQRTSCSRSVAFWSLSLALVSALAATFIPHGEKSRIGTHMVSQKDDPPPPPEFWGQELYCFMVVTPGTYEEELDALAKSLNTSIYACDGYKVFKRPNNRLTDEQKRGEVPMLRNIHDFQEVWRQVMNANEYGDFDWTIKVDPDVVFTPSKVRSFIEGSQIPWGSMAYIPGPEQPSSIVIMSRDTVNHMKDEARCQDSKYGGAGGWIQTCMEEINANRVQNDQLIARNYPYSASKCSDDTYLAYYALKTQESWTACARQVEPSLVVKK